MRRWVLIIVWLALMIPPVTLFLEKPPDGPIIITPAGFIIDVQNVKVTDGSLLYSWDERQILFNYENDPGGLNLVVDPRHGHFPINQKCRLSYQEKWVFDFLGIDWRRTTKLISIEIL